MNRRQFLIIPAAVAVSRRTCKATVQTFKAGIVPAGPSSSSSQIDTYWSYCDEVAGLGFHHIEINNTRARIAEYYVDRVPEFKDAMAKRQLRMAGMALFSRVAQTAESQNVIDQHMVLGRLLSAVGGEYITHMIAPSDVLNEPEDEAAYGSIDMKTWVKNANEIGRRLLEEWGVKLAYHPEQGEVRSGLHRRFLESTDERYVYFLADSGHIASGGADAVEVCKVYRSRLACVHLKDFSPARTGQRGMKAGNVPFGEGVVNLAGIVGQLRSADFAGYVMGESGGTNQSVRDYMTGPLGLHIE